jgi:hypothetical protein
MKTRHLSPQLALVVMAALVGAGSVEAAVRLDVSNDTCHVTPCPTTHPVPPLTAVKGQPFYLAVSALNADDSRDTLYTGTIHLSSSDPAAVLPATFSMVSQDEGGRLVLVTLNTLGPQALNAADEGAVPLTGSTTLTVLASSQGIPALSVLGSIALAFGIGVIGALLAREGGRA